ncbi:protein tesmin/TSO1-like CXC 2 [Malania oleifera]|uniref:protein tesmin/TSO1-like CXC 2 n=1 Tax=Malania oleifera TaxID=397392 RepID=UPI0025ADB1B0|nr:protein tesmin/TSO1-like CXC 2 [Malania oleifera]
MEPFDSEKTATRTSGATAAAATISSSESPAVQDSPIFCYISTLSPIKPVKAAHVAHGFLDLSSPPLLFTSPRINSPHEKSSLRRPRHPQPYTAEFSQSDDKSKKTDAVSDVAEKSITQLNSRIVTDAQKDLNIQDSIQPCKSPVSVEHMVDPVEVEFGDKIYIQKDETKIKASLAFSEQPEQELQGRSMNTKLAKTEGEQNDVEKLSAESPDVKSSLSLDHAPKQPQCEQSMCQIVWAHNDCDGNSQATSNGAVENKMLHNSEASQHRDMLRRCLQFEDAEPNPTTNSPSSWNLTTPVTNSSLPVSDSPHEELTAASSGNKSMHLPQPMVTLLSSRNTGKSFFSVPKPSGIGLHLNSIVNALPMDCSATASMKLAEKNYLSVQRMNSEVLMSHSLFDDMKGSTISSNGFEKSSTSTEDERHDTEGSIGQSLAASQHPHSMKPLSSSLLLKRTELSESSHDKRKSNSEHADNFEEFNQIGPPKKRMKASSTGDGDGCKRCNCKKSKCLKLYCECFAAGMYCSEPCACNGCFNKPEYEDKVLETRQQIESRNPLAFAPKIVRRNNLTPTISVEEGNYLTPSLPRHKKGCNCKRSMCLKKYCECYQANVGCSDACRCEGCKNAYGRKEDYDLISNVGKSASDERLADTCDEEKLEIAAFQNNFLNTELCNPQNLTPVTPLFQCLEMDGSKFQLPSRRHAPSPESDVTIFSSYEKSPRSPRNSDTNHSHLKTGEMLDMDSCHQESYHGRAAVDPVTPRCALANICHLAPLPNVPRTALASSALSKTRQWITSSQSQLCPESSRPSSSGSLRWRSSPSTPMSQLGTAKFLQGLDFNKRLCDILEDDMPEILKDAPAPTEAVKVSSPNRKRVSPPHGCLQQLESSSSAGLRSRKFILRSIPFPPLTPCIKPKSSSNENKIDQHESARK